MLCCFHLWPETPPDLFPSNIAWHSGSSRTTRECNIKCPYSSNNGTYLQFKWAGYYCFTSASWWPWNHEPLSWSKSWVSIVSEIKVTMWLVEKLFPKHMSYQKTSMCVQRSRQPEVRKKSIWKLIWSYQEHSTKKSIKISRSGWRKSSIHLANSGADERNGFQPEQEEV